MDDYMTTTQIFINRLNDKIVEYAERHGEYPKCIMLTNRAYRILDIHARDFWLVPSDSGQILYYKGFKVRMISGDGCEVFLAGEPITLRE